MLAQLEASIADIDDRYYRFFHQQRSFAEALTNARSGLYVPEAVKSLNEVSQFLNSGKLERSNDVRIVENFLVMCDDLEGLRKDMKRYLIDCLEIKPDLKHLKQTKNLMHSMNKWRTMLDPEFDFSELRAKWPHYNVQKLSSVEAKLLYAGIVSFLPILIDTVKIAFKYLKLIDKKSVWNQNLKQDDQSFQEITARTDASSHLSNTLACSRQSSRTHTTNTLENGTLDGELEVQMDQTSRPVTVASVSHKSGSHKVSVPLSRKSSDRASKTASSARSGYFSTSVRQSRPSSRVELARSRLSAKSGSGMACIDILVDEGVAHGEAEVTTPKPSRGVIRKSCRLSATPAFDSKTPLSTLRQRLKSNPSDISVIQEKLRSLYSNSEHGTRSIPDFGVQVVNKTPPPRQTARSGSRGESAAWKKSEIRFTPPTTRNRPVGSWGTLSAMSVVNSGRGGGGGGGGHDEAQEQEVDFVHRWPSKDNLHGHMSRTPSKDEKKSGSDPVSELKTETTKNGARSNQMSCKRRTTALSSQHLSQLLGLPIKSRSESGALLKQVEAKNEQKQKSEAICSSIMSLKSKLAAAAAAVDEKDRDVLLLSPTGGSFHSNSTSHKLTVPRTRGTDRMWQP